ncbi:MAG: crossover junction endodeoxyribonuclease RuvC [Patescibacteria group bacterium]|nr:crossover junction endodeoxyribonuclease RuvC [Patescibacteria group bacterium]
MIILGVDPGIADTGFGLIKKEGPKLSVIDYGSIKTKAGVPTEDRLLDIYNSLDHLIVKYRPTVMVVEKLFFSKNVKTAMIVSQARGVVMVVAGKRKLDVKEYTPIQIKLALTSYGQADKKQIQQMVKIVLDLPTPPKSDDAADALAAAICCAHQLNPKN